MFGNFVLGLAVQVLCRSVRHISRVGSLYEAYLKGWICDESFEIEIMYVLVSKLIYRHCIVTFSTQISIGKFNFFCVYRSMSI